MSGAKSQHQHVNNNNKKKAMLHKKQMTSRNGQEKKKKKKPCHENISSRRTLKILRVGLVMAVPVLAVGDTVQVPGSGQQGLVP